MKAFWHPSDQMIQQSNIGQVMTELGFDEYKKFWSWSAQKKAAFWDFSIKKLGIVFKKKYGSVLDISQGVEQAQWLKGAQLNITESCFQNSTDATAVIYQKEGEQLQRVTQGEFERFVDRIAAGFSGIGLEPGDRMAIDMPMTYSAISIYLAAIKAGLSVVAIADSFSAQEIEIRLKITQPKALFTQDLINRSGKRLEHYQKIIQANPPLCVVVASGDQKTWLRNGDIFFDDYIAAPTDFSAHHAHPDTEITVLFSSGTTGQPKAIPWTHSTPVKCASDGFYHHDIQKGNVVCWPTNLGWMMGPWLIFASLINKGTIALYEGAPMGDEFGEFVEKAGVNMLGVVPSLVRNWKNSACMEKFNWSKIKCFSSTGEASNKEEMEYLMSLAGNKPVIEYCGGTEIGGGYVTGTLVQPNVASAFSTQALGGSFVLLDENHQPADQGEVFIIPPIIGLSQSLLNKDHHEVYYKGTPTYRGKPLRRHGDELLQLKNGYFKALGRADDAMNLGGIKVSSVQIEELVNQLSFVKESAAIGVSPKDGGPSKLIIYTVPKASALDDQQKLDMAKQLIKQQLNPLFKLSQLIEIDQLPRTASGKVMRRKLRDLCQ